MQYNALRCGRAADNRDVNRVFGGRNKHRECVTRIRHKAIRHFHLQTRRVAAQTRPTPSNPPNHKPLSAYLRGRSKESWQN